jgi:hypothetical protein
LTKITLHTEKRARDQRERPAISRPDRLPALDGATVGVVLANMGAAQRRLNDYLMLAHVAAGLALMAFCVDDIMYGGPSRPVIIPLLGGYVSASVVFHTVLRERSPALLMWINGMSDVVLLVAAQHLAFAGFGSMGPELTGAFLILVVSALYGLSGQPRLSAAIGGIAIVFFGLSLFGPSSGVQVFDPRSIVALLLAVGAVAAGIRIARVIEKSEISNSIRTLERMELAVTIQRLRNTSRLQVSRG